MIVKVSLLSSAALSVCLSAAFADSDSVVERADGRVALRPVAQLPGFINECSGIALHAGAFWALNDSGGQPRLFRSLEPTFRNAQALRVDGAENVDWEELTPYQGDLLVCDMGDNRRRRSALTLYRVRYVPTAADRPAHLQRVATYTIAYPDGPHDAEGAFAVGSTLFVVSKDRGEGHAAVYCWKTLEAERTNVGAAIATLDLPLGVQITGADCDPHTGAVVLLSYTHIYTYFVGVPTRAPLAALRIDAGQSESICFDRGRLIFTTEQRDVFVIDSFLARELKEALSDYPKVYLPRGVRRRTLLLLFRLKVGHPPIGCRG